MRTTPPTSPTLTQPVPKFSQQYSPSHVSTLDTSPYATSSSPPTLSTSSSYSSQAGSTASTSTSASSYYLNSPYAPQPRSYKSTTSTPTSVTTSSPTSPAGKGKLPSGLCMHSVVNLISPCSLLHSIATQKNREPSE